MAKILSRFRTRHQWRIGSSSWTKCINQYRDRSWGLLSLKVGVIRSLSMLNGTGSSSSWMYLFAFGSLHTSVKSPGLPLRAAQSSIALVSGTTTATRKDSKLFP